MYPSSSAQTKTSSGVCTPSKCDEGSAHNYRLIELSQLNSMGALLAHQAYAGFCLKNDGRRQQGAGCLKNSSGHSPLMSSYLLHNSPKCRKLKNISPLTRSCVYQQRSISIANLIVTLRAMAGPARLPMGRRHSPKRLPGTLGAADQSYRVPPVPSCFDDESLWVTLQKPP